MKIIANNRVEFRGNETPTHFVVKSLYALAIYRIHAIERKRHYGKKVVSTEMLTDSEDYIDVVDDITGIAYEVQENMNAEELKSKERRYLLDHRIERVVFIPLSLQKRNFTDPPVISNKFKQSLEKLYKEVEEYISIQTV